MENLSNLIPADFATRKKFIYNYFAGGTDGQLTDEELAETCKIIFYL